MRLRRLWLALTFASTLGLGLAVGLQLDSQAEVPVVTAPETGPSAVSAPVRFLPEPPAQISLCGEPVPLDSPMVAEALDREFNIAVHDQAQVVMWLKRARRYFPLISRKLKAAGLPDDLKYVAVAESALLTRVRSHAGAVGPWQFMRSTARRYGLRVDRWFDQRRDLAMATDAAIRYLKDLYEEFGSWPLAMAAYNTGEARIRRELADQEVGDYYQLYLFNETQRYVFRILAAKIILSDPGAYGYQLPDDRLYKPLPSELAKVRLKRTTHLTRVAKAAGTTFRHLRDLNPAIRTAHLPRGAATLRVPPGAAAQLQDSLAKQPAGQGRAASRDQWVVRRGDTLTAISRQTGVSVRRIKRANRLSGSTIRVGQRLIIPGG